MALFSQKNLRSTVSRKFSWSGCSLNVSPADYNCEETINSFNYAARVRCIENEVKRNTESKEIVRLKNVIRRMRQGDLEVEMEEVGLF